MFYKFCQNRNTTATQLHHNCNTTATQLQQNCKKKTKKFTKHKKTYIFFAVVLQLCCSCDAVVLQLCCGFDKTCKTYHIYM